MMTTLPSPSTTLSGRCKLPSESISVVSLSTRLRSSGNHPYPEASRMRSERSVLISSASAGVSSPDETERSTAASRSEGTTTRERMSCKTTPRILPEAEMPASPSSEKKSAASADSLRRPLSSVPPSPSSAYSGFRGTDGYSPPSDTGNS